MRNDFFNRYLDNLVRPKIWINNKPHPAFKVCGYAGLVLAIILTMSLVVYQSLSLWVMAGIVILSALTFLGLAIVTKIITGAEHLTYYHHEIAMIIVVSIFLWLLHKPILPYLDVTVLGIGLFLVCGRVGCFMVGCCYGRPNHFGVCYRKEHADVGFVHYLVNARLFPIQLLESLWVLFTVIIGSLFILGRHQHGTTLAWYITIYGLCRFCIEFARGDYSRRYLLGFSEAQWTSLLLMGLVTWLEIIDVLPFHLWQVLLTVCVVFSMIVITLKRRFQKVPRYQLLHPRHIKEVAEVIEIGSNKSSKVTANSNGNKHEDIYVGHTSNNILISTSKIENMTGSIDCYTFSYQKGTMTEKVARILADLVICLKYPSSSNKLIEGNHGSFHLLIF